MCVELSIHGVKEILSKEANPVTDNFKTAKFSLRHEHHHDHHGIHYSGIDPIVDWLQPMLAFSDSTITDSSSSSLIRLEVSTTTLPPNCWNHPDSTATQDSGRQGAMYMHVLSKIQPVKPVLFSNQSGQEVDHQSDQRRARPFWPQFRAMHEGYS